MKKTIMIMATALVMAFAAQAQDAPRHRGMEPRNFDPEKMVEMQVKHLDKELNLTDKQKAAITEIFLVEAKEMQKRMEAKHQQRAQEKADKGQQRGQQGGGAFQKRDDSREKMEEHRKALDARIVSVLTPDQQARYAQMKEERPHGKHHGHHGMKGGHDCDKKGGESCEQMKAKGGHDCDKKGGECCDKQMKPKDGKDCGKACCEGDKKGTVK